MKILLAPILALVSMVSISACQGEQEEKLENKASDQGRLVADSTQQVLAKNLKNAIQTKGLIQAIDFCNVEAMPLTAELEEVLGVTIKRTTLKVRNPANAPDQLERSILQEYDSLAGVQQNIGARTHWVNEQQLLYTQPIIINNALCLNCHGQPGQTMVDTVYAFIKDKYPEDKAINYALGDLRGMWSIRFQKEQLESMLAGH